MKSLHSEKQHETKYGGKSEDKQPQFDHDIARDPVTHSKDSDCQSRESGLLLIKKEVTKILE